MTVLFAVGLISAVDGEAGRNDVLAFFLIFVVACDCTGAGESVMRFG
jgi:hypothetical protein